MRIADAGLPAPWLLRRGEEPAELTVRGQRLPLGLFPAIEYRASEITLEPGDRLLLLTDGIPEAPVGGGEVLGYEGFATLLAGVHREAGSRRGPDRLSADRWLDALLERVSERVGRPGSGRPGSGLPGSGHPAAERGSAARRPARELTAAAPYTLADDWTALVIERT